MKIGFFLSFILNSMTSVVLNRSFLILVFTGHVMFNDGGKTNEVLEAQSNLEVAIKTLLLVFFKELSVYWHSKHLFFTSNVSILLCIDRISDSIIISINPLAFVVLDFVFVFLYFWNKQFLKSLFRNKCEGFYGIPLTYLFLHYCTYYY